MAKSGSFYVSFSIPFLETKELPAVRRKLHSVFFEAAKSLSFPTTEERIAFFYGADDKQPYVPEVDRAIFHLWSSGVLTLNHELGEPVFEIPKRGKDELRKLSTKLEKHGRVTAGNLATCKAFAELIDKQVGTLVAASSR